MLSVAWSRHFSDRFTSVAIGAPFRYAVNCCQNDYVNGKWVANQTQHDFVNWQVVHRRLQSSSILETV